MEGVQAVYLILEYSDGETETVYYPDESGDSLRLEANNVVIRNGGGETYQHGTVQGFPLHNVRRWRTSHEEPVG